MTDRQKWSEIEKNKYNAELKTKVVKYLGCSIEYRNSVGFGYFIVITPWETYINYERFSSIITAKAAVKKVYDKKKATQQA